MKPFDLLLSTAYAPPISYFAKLYEYQGKAIGLEAQEHYLKQSYRNRCRILSPNGVQALTIPVEQSLSLKTKIRDVRISEQVPSSSTMLMSSCPSMSDAIASSGISMKSSLGFSSASSSWR